MTSTLIVGAGLVLALALLRNGVPVRIIEKRARDSVGTRGAGLQPRTLELYQTLGVGSDIRAASVRLLPTRMYTSPEGPTHVSEMIISEQLEDTPAYPFINCVALGQDRHEAILRAHLVKDYDISVELGTELKSFTQTQDHVEARLVKHVDGKEVEEVVRTEFLVGADGARGVVRKQLGLTFLGESHEELARVIGNVRIKSGIPDRKYWRLWGGAKTAMLMLIPTDADGDLYQFLAGGPNVDAQKLANDREELFQHMSSTIGRDLEFGELVSCSAYSPNIRMVDKFGEGRVFVAGDAAHVHSPAGAQGLNSSVQDSINLGWKLGLVHKGLAPLSILNSYTEERLPIIATMLNKTTEFMMLNKFSTVTIDPKGFTKGFEMRQLGINYRGSLILVDEKHAEEQDAAVDPYRGGLDGIVKAGDRAPAAPGLIRLGDGSALSLFDLFSPSKHTMLVFSGEGLAEANEALNAVEGVFPEGTIQTALIHPQSFDGPSASSGKPGTLALVDKEGYAFKHYNVGPQDKHSVFLVRPDGYIGAIVEGAEGLKKYGGLVFRS